MERGDQSAGQDGWDIAADVGAALDGLADIDPTVLDDAELRLAVLGCIRAQARLGAATCAFVSEWDVRGAWADTGARTAGAALASAANVSPAQAHAIVRRARALTRMPLTAEAYAAGEIAAEHVDVVSTANAHDWPAVSFADAEEMLVGFCRTMRFADAKAAVGYWVARADTERDERTGARLHRRRHLTVAETLDGTVHVQGLLDPVGGAAFTDELDRLMRELIASDRRDGLDRTTSQRRVDALVEMAIRSRSAPPGSVRPRPLVTILVGTESFTRTCELARGTRLAPNLVVPLLDDADIERVVFDSPDRVLAVSRRRRFTGAVRRAIEVRDRHCQHPAGCDVPARWCDVDHVVPWSHGGQTSIDNGRLGCPTHNRTTPLPPRRTGTGPAHVTPGEDGDSDADSSDDDITEDDSSDDDILRP